MPTWVAACGIDDVAEEDVIRFDHDARTFAVYCAEDGSWFASDGLCTHERVHLADGYVAGFTIECPKHNGRFDIRTGEPKGPPVCLRLRTYAVRVEAGMVQIQID